MSANTLGSYIIEYRKKNKLTQAALAEMLYVSNKTVSRWETGAGEPDLDQLARISELIGVPVAKLIGGADEPSDMAAAEAAASKKKIFPIVIFVALALLVVTAAILPPVLVLACHVSEDPVPPDSAPTPEVTAIFEAEYAHLKAMNPQLDGTDSFVERSATASNGLHIAYFGAKGNTVTFEIESTASDPDAMLYIAVVSLWDDSVNTHLETDFDSIWELYVNGERIGVKKTYRSPHDDNAYHDFVEVSVKVSLKQGQNIIKMICPQTGDGQYGLNTDYIRFETAATLSWFPYKENKIRLE